MWGLSASEVQVPRVTVSSIIEKAARELQGHFDPSGPEIPQTKSEKNLPRPPGPGGAKKSEKSRVNNSV